MPLTPDRLRLLRLPQAFTERLFPDNRASVKDFLAFPLPAQRASTHFTDAESYLVSSPPTHADIDISTLTMPPDAVLRTLMVALAAADESDAYDSVACPHIPGNKSTYPLYLVSYWVELIDVRDTRRQWEAAHKALTKQLETAPGNVAAQTAHTKMLALPWGGSLAGFDERVGLPALARFCTRDWLQTTHINLMLELVDLRGELSAAGLQVLPSEHGRDIMDLYADGGEGYDTEKGYAKLRKQGQDFGTGLDAKLATVVNINANHWVGLVIDFESKTVLYGDPLRGSAPIDLKRSYNWWIAQHNLDDFTWQILPSTAQTDSFSCGILAHNAVDHYLRPDRVPLLSMADAVSMRLQVFNEIIEHHERESKLLRHTSDGFEFSFRHDLTMNDLEIIPNPTQSPKTAGSDSSPFRFTANDKANDKIERWAPPSLPLSPFSDAEHAGPVSITPPASPSITPPPSPQPRKLAAMFSPAKPGVKRSTPERGPVSPPTSPSKKRPNNWGEKEEKLISATTRGLKAMEEGGKKVGLFAFMSKQTPAEKAKEAQDNREWADAARERVAAEALMKKRKELQQKEDVRIAATERKRKQRGIEKEIEIELGIRSDDGSLKKARTEIQPVLHDPGVDHNIAKRTRTRRVVKAESPNTPTTGPPFIFRQILAAGRVNIHAIKGLSTTGIVKTLQSRDNYTFHKLNRTTLDGWTEINVEGKKVWKKKILEEVELRGDRPGNLNGGRRKAFTGYPEITEMVSSTLTRLRQSGAPLTVITVRAIIIATIQKSAPEIFDKTYRDNSKFHASDSFCREFLRTEMRWSERHSTKAAQKLPTDWEDQCERAALRRAHIIQTEDIPAELIINSDQTGVVYNPGGRLTWAPRGSRQVSLIGAEEKRAFTALLGITASGTVLPVQAVYEGLTKQSCPRKDVPKYEECIEEGFQFVPSQKKRNHWSNQLTMRSYVCDILQPYIRTQIEKLALSASQKALWIIDVWSVHRSEEFRDYVRDNHSNIIIDFVPGGTTGVGQPLDVGINRPFKQSMKTSYHAGLVDGLLGQMDRNEPLHFDTHVGPLRDSSVEWMWTAYKFIQKPELVKSAFSRCVVREWDLSFESLTSPAIRARLREERDKNTEFWQELQTKRGNFLDIPADVVVAEDEMPDVGLGEEDGVDDSDISPHQVAADVRGKKRARVGRKTGGGLTAAALSESTEVGDDDDGAQPAASKGGRAPGKRQTQPNTRYTDFWRHYDEDDEDVDE
ncbi:hypothetical protein C8F01DRAFT_1344185 [Mycena amicta]|nr:hypothetical protein C8F01DRAFT_1344185 [Mycena amicta]